MKCTSIKVVQLEVLLFCHLCFHFSVDASTLYFGDTGQWTMSLVGSFVQSYATGMVRQEKSDNEIQSEKEGEKYALSNVDSNPAKPFESPSDRAANAV